MLDMLTLDGHDKVFALGPSFLLPDDREVAWAGAKEHVINRWDFGWVMGNFLQCDPDGTGASANRNGHVFDLEQMRKQHPMIRYTPLNMLHRDNHNVGTFVASEMLDPRTVRATVEDRAMSPMPFPYVETLAALWRYKCPSDYRAVRDAYDAGHAFFSMEAYPESMTCMVPGCCGRTFPYKGTADRSYCASLQKPGSRKRLNNPSLVGGALVIPPANPGWSRAELKQVAGLIVSHPDDAESVYEQIAASTPGLEPAQCEDLVLVILSAAFDGEETDVALPVSFDWDAAFRRLVDDDGSDGEGQAPKTLVNYRPADGPDQQCATCMHFDPNRTCSIVEGDIDPGAVCDSWSLSDPMFPAGFPTNFDTVDELLDTAVKVRDARDAERLRTAIATAAAEALAGQVVAAGLVVVAADTGRVLMLQRSNDPGDPAAGLWEFPGGKLEEGEEPYDAAVREWTEEVGHALPAGEVAGSWTSPNGVYQGFVYVITSEATLDLNLDAEDRHVLNPDDPDGDLIEVVAWWDPAHLPGMPALRPECRTTDWNMVMSAAPARP